MSRCSSCGNPAAAGARFCSSCGAPVGTTPVGAPPPAVQSPPPAPTSSANPERTGLSPSTWAAIGGGVVLLGVAGFLFARSAGLLGAPSPKAQPTAVLSAPKTDPPPAPVLAAPQTDSAPAPILETPETASVPMPEDVAAYLRWLKKFDNDLRKVIADLEAVGISIIPELYTGMIDKVAGDEDQAPRSMDDTLTTRAEGMVEQVNKLAMVFRQVPPPDACAPLAAAYTSALGSAVRGVAQLAGTYSRIAASFSGDVNQGGQDRQSMLPDLVKQLKGGGLSGAIDQEFSAADTALDALRERYNQVPSDIRGGAFQILPVDSGLDASKFLSGGKLGF